MFLGASHRISSINLIVFALVFDQVKGVASSQAHRVWLERSAQSTLQR